jgi:hypothetical protein
MRFSPNPNNCRPIIHTVDEIDSSLIGLYEFVDPMLPQKPYFILSHVDDVERIVESLSTVIYPLRLTYHTEGNITHVVLTDVYCIDGIQAQEFYNKILRMVPADDLIHLFDIRSNSRLYGRYIRLFDLDSSITGTTGCLMIPDDDITTIRTIYDYIMYYMPTYDLKWLLPSYLTLHSNSP